jgi:hypothetical protein
MRIENSSVQLSGSSISVEKQAKEESLKMWIGNTRPTFAGEKPAGLFTAPENTRSGDILKLSEEGQAALKKQLAAALAGTGINVQVEDEDDLQLSDKDKNKIYLLQRMIEVLTGKRLKFNMPKGIKPNHPAVNPQAVNIQGQQPVQVQTPAQRRKGWGMEYELHETHYEKQTMSFSAEGVVKTADGRQLKFDLDLNISREFASKADVSLRAGDAVKVDPLVINFGSPSATLTNNKFKFDIDADGDSEQISFTTGGSGFLAFDVNSDGTINNGSELFGPQSGNGFTDLEKYDGDNNGWIDENDEIYNKLRIWSKDESGNDQLFALGAKGIGAIYLGNIATAFDMKTNTNQTTGSVASTGIFLKENGLAGTIQHLDLTI